MFPCLILLKDHVDEPELVRARIIPDVEQVLIFLLKTVRLYFMLRWREGRNRPAHRL